VHERPVGNQLGVVSWQQKIVDRHSVPIPTKTVDYHELGIYVSKIDGA